MSRTPIQIPVCDGNSLADAFLVDDLTSQDLLDLEKEWKPTRTSICNMLIQFNVSHDKIPQSLNWNWGKKLPPQKCLSSSITGIVCDGKWQGAMLTWKAIHATEHAPDTGKPLVYVDFLEKAPWNWRIPEIGQQGKYKGIGTFLIRSAIQQSIDEGFHGRIGLHSLPQAERFYTDACKMMAIRNDPKKYDLLYLELSRQEAAKLLQ